MTDTATVQVPFDFLTEENMLFGHTDEASAYVVDDYPYGFRLRTQIRYWIETTKHGDRLVSQTLNPKVAHEHWNKPKKSTYLDAGVMYLDEKGHVTWTGVSNYTEADALAAFVAKTAGHLTEAQQKKIGILAAVRKVMKDVTFTVTETTHQTAEERAANDAEQDKIKSFLVGQINRSIPTGTAVVALSNEMGKAV